MFWFNGKKKWIAFIMVVIMVFTLLPTDFSWAESSLPVSTTEEDIENTTSVEDGTQQVVEGETEAISDIGEATTVLNRNAGEDTESVAELPVILNTNEEQTLLGAASQSILDGTGIDIKSVTLSKVDKNGTTPVQDGDTIKTTDTLDYSLTFSIGSAFTISGGVEYTYQLPSGINIKQSFTVPLTNQSNGQNLGTAYIDSETGLITFQFDVDQMKPNTNFGLQFGGGLSSESSEAISEETISFPTANGTWDYRLNVEQDGSSSEGNEPGEISVAKYGTQAVNYTQGGTTYRAIRWEVSVNPNGRKPFNATVKDVLPTGLDYIPGSAVLTDEAWGSTGTVAVTDASGTLTFDITDSKPNSGYTKLVFYTTYEDSVYGAIDNATSKVIDNTVVVTPDGETDTGAKGSVTLTPKVLTKSGSTDATNGVVNWKVTINEEGLNIGGTTYQDVFQAGISGLTTEEQNALKTQLESQLPAGATLTVNGNGFSVVFPAGYNQKLEITYETPIKDYTTTTFKNQGTISGGTTPTFNYSTTGTAPGVDLIKKSGVGYTQIGEYFTWKVVINQAKITLGDGVFITEEMIACDGYTPELVSVTKSDGTKITPDASGHYVLGNIDGEMVELTIVTRIPESTKPATGWHNQNNKVHLYWDNGTKTTFAEAGISYNYITPDLAEKSGKMDSENGKIDWTVKIKCQEGLSQDKVTIKDTLPTDMVLVEDSLVLKADWGYSDVKLQSGDYTYDVTSGILEVVLDKSDSRFAGILGIEGQWRSYTLSYSTKLDVTSSTALDKANQNETYTNHADITFDFPGDVTITETETATVTGSIGGLLGKEYVYQSGSQEVSWTVKVNEAGYDLSSVTNPRIVDTLPSYFDYVTDSGVLLKKDGTKVPKSDYSISFINRVLMVNLPSGGGTEGYTFQFTTRFNCYDTQLPDSVTNSVSFIGLGETVTVTSNKVENISFSYASGWSETNAEIRVRKVDSRDHVGLANATMTLKMQGITIDTKVSDAQGFVRFPITYDSNATLTVEIYENQAPEGYAMTNSFVTVTLDENTIWKTDESTPDLKYTEVLFENSKITKSGTFYIKKTDREESSLCVADAVYELYSDSACLQSVGTLTTDENGEAHYSLEAPSSGTKTYYLKEKTSPGGYRLDSVVYEIEIDSDGTVTYPGSATTSTKDGKTALKLQDEKAKGTLILKKTDASNSSLSLSGARFGIYLDTACNNQVGEITTDASGEGSLTGLALGQTYYYRELTAPDGYIIDTTIYSVVVGTGADTTDQTKAITITNEKQNGIIKIIKTDDSASKVSLAGVKFKLQKKNTTTGVYEDYSDPQTGMLVTATTNELGIAQITGLPYGDYKLVETVGPGDKYDYHVQSTDGVLVTVDSSNAKEVSIVNQLIHFHVTLKKVGEAGQPLSGVVFGLYDAYGALKRTGTTDADGKLTFLDIEIGDYYVKEISAPAGYKVKDTKYNISQADIKAAYDTNGYQTPTISLNSGSPITNEKEDGYIAFYKYQTDSFGASTTTSVLSGAVFTLYDANGFEVARATSDVNGLVEFKNLAYGTYEIRETTVPEGYTSDGNLYTVTVNKDETEGFYTIATGSIVNGSVNGTYVSGTTVNNTIAGKVYNEKIPDNKVKYLSFYVVKTYQDAINGASLPLSGAVFTFSKSTDGGNSWTDVTTVTSDTNGRVEIHNYDIDGDADTTQYKLEEIQAPAGYRIPSDGSGKKIYTKTELATGDYGHSSFINDFTSTSFVMKELCSVNNEMILGSITINKKSTGNNVPIKGAEFTVYEADGTTIAKDVHGNLLKDLSTDANGICKVNNLKLGKYIVKETKVPKGYYVALEKTETVILADTDNTTEEDTNPSVTFWNSKINLSFDKRIKGGSTSISGATIGVYDGGTQLERFVTTGSVVSLTSSLYEIGKVYTIREIKAPEGYSYSGDITFVVNRDGTITITSAGGGKSDHTIIMEDEEISLTFKKVDSLSAGLSGALVSFRKEDGTILSQFTTNGQIQIVDCSKVVVPESGYAYYFFREESSPFGYEVAEDIKLAIDKNGKWYEVTAAGMASTNITQVTMTDIQKSDLYFAKVDATDSAIRIQGATLKLTDEGDPSKTYEWDTTTTATKLVVGTPYGSGLSLTVGGTYRLEETKAPDGYKVAEPITFKVIQDVSVTPAKPKMQIISGDASSLYYDGMTIAMKDEPIQLKIKKMDENSKLIYGAVFDLYEAGGSIPVKADITTTKTNPIVTLSGSYLKANKTYELVEKKAPTGYSILERSITFTINGSGEVVINGVVCPGNQIAVKNTEKVFTIQKKDGATGYPLSGVTFTISSTQDTSFIPVSWVSGTEPKEIGYQRDGIRYDMVYRLSETTAVGGYTYAEDMEFYISSTDEKLYDARTHQEILNGAIVVTDEPFALSVDKRITGSGDWLEGATLRIVDESGQVVDTWVTDGSSHEVDVSKIMASKVIAEHIYTLEEVAAPEYYALAQPISFYINRNGKVYLTNGEAVANNRLVMEDEFLGIAFRKVNENGENIEGATLEITSKEDSGFVPVTWVSTKTPKNLDASLFIPGITYTMTEVIAPKGYAYASSVDFTVDAGGMVYVDGEMVDNKTITMMDSSLELYLDKKIAGTDTYLEGAEFGVYSVITGEELATFTSDAGTTTVLTAKLCVYQKEGDDYYVMKEIKAPKGYDLAEDVYFYFTSDGALYVLDKEKSEFVLKENHTITVYDAISTTTTSKKTGDGMPVKPMAVLFGLSVAGSIILATKKKKRRG